MYTFSSSHMVERKTVGSQLSRQHTPACMGKKTSKSFIKEQKRFEFFLIRLLQEKRSPSCMSFCLKDDNRWSNAHPRSYTTLEWLHTTTCCKWSHCKWTRDLIFKNKLDWRGLRSIQCQATAKYNFWKKNHWQSASSVALPQSTGLHFAN